MKKTQGNSLQVLFETVFLPRIPFKTLKLHGLEPQALKDSNSRVLAPEPLPKKPDIGDAANWKLREPRSTRTAYSVLYKTFELPI